jgi:hypothetical protein
MGNSRLRDEISDQSEFVSRDLADWHTSPRGHIVRVCCQQRQSNPHERRVVFTR